jgi:hypothetical protein
MLATAIFESIYSDVADQNIRLNAIACPKQITHCNEMNDQIFNIDIDMNI